MPRLFDLFDGDSRTVYHCLTLVAFVSFSLDNLKLSSLRWGFKEDLNQQCLFLQISRGGTLYAFLATDGERIYRSVHSRTTGH
jgi:hypothetical protein